MLIDADREVLLDLAPVLRRAITLDARSLARVRMHSAVATVLVRLPFGVLVSRTVAAPVREAVVDIALRSTELIDWLDHRTAPPQAHDAEWRTGLPPSAGWTRVERIPDDVVRGLVRSGASALQDAAAREGVPGAQPRAEVADALLDATVLTATNADGADAEVSLRAVSALTRMGFLPRGGTAFIDTVGRWTRVVAEYGTVYLERSGSGLTLT